MVGVIRSQGIDRRDMLAESKDIRDDLRSMHITLSEHTSLLHMILERLPEKE